MHHIMLIYKNPKNGIETIIKFFDDKAPYNLKQEKLVEFPTYWATVAFDYRGLTGQNNNKVIYVGLNSSINQDNILIKL